MKIVQKLDYAVRVMIQLALRYDHSTLSQLDDLAETEAVSVHFLAQILNELRRSNLVVSKRGKNGGYQLAREPETITLYDIIAVMEGELLDHDKTNTGASGEVAANAWSRLNNVLSIEAQKMTLETLSGKTQTPMFF
ncbi:MAG: Rrf2 family transcriptional regulator, partial [Akkermansia sp.]